MNVDLRLHRAIHQIAGNPKLTAVAEETQLRVQAIRLRCAGRLKSRPVQAYKEHEQIVEAIRRGDADTAAEAAAHTSTPYETKSHRS